MSERKWGDANHEDSRTDLVDTDNIDTTSLPASIVGRDCWPYQDEREIHQPRWRWTKQKTNKTVVSVDCSDYHYGDGAHGGGHHHGSERDDRHKANWIKLEGKECTGTRRRDNALRKKETCLLWSMLVATITRRWHMPNVFAQGLSIIMIIFFTPFPPSIL